jgi:uncharacterized protein YjbI with pentapeptide repeats
MNCITDIDGQTLFETDKGVRMAFIAGALKGLNLRKADFRGADLRDAPFGGLDLSGANFSGANLASASFEDAILDDVQFHHSNLCRANLTNAHTYRTSFYAAYLVGATIPRDLMDMILEEVNLEGADLYWGFLSQRMKGARLYRADCRGAAVVNVDLRAADLRYVDFGLDNLGGQTDLEGTDLREARLEGANLIGAHIKGVHWSGSTYSDETVFPDGFDPEAHGMIRTAASARA